MFEDFVYDHTVLATVLIFIGVIGTIVAISYPVTRYSCQKEAEALHLPYNYGFWSNCKVQLHNGTWVDIDNYQGVNLDEKR